MQKMGFIVKASTHIGLSCRLCQNIGFIRFSATRFHHCQTSQPAFTDKNVRWSRLKSEVDTGSADFQQNETDMISTVGELKQVVQKNC